MRIRTTLLMLTLSLCLARMASGQRERGELHVEIRDSQGAAVGGEGELVSELNQVRRGFKVGPEGRSIVQELPFGRYYLRFSAQGFADWSGIVEIHSVVPQTVAITLGVAPVNTQIQVSDSATLIDPSRTGVTYAIGKNAIEEQVPAQIGHTVGDLVNEQPGWIYEANGVLHPRGSEYDVQFVFDGLPLTQNRSPAFAPSLDTEEVESLRVLTASFPAEYGRKLGGIVEVTTEKNPPSGIHGRFEASGGSFSSAGTSTEISYARDKSRISFAGQGFHADRYLDPPVRQNFTNRGNGNGFSVSYERDSSDRDRLRLSVSHNVVRFLVPNELIQQNADQRQDIANLETGGQIHFRHILSPEL
ncbi:MAG TPA: carboxypeptidase-like regulatory domain-containing protein, partial [Candidatus Acidoferrum sp.]|nr:carboxypeptidase-like regulatory domain-containing protein [Candidatus Acidoferrum sp.]